MDRNTLIDGFASLNYQLMIMMDKTYFEVWAGLLFAAFLFGMTPLLRNPNLTFMELVGTTIRKAILYSGVLLIALPFISLYIYDASQAGRTEFSTREFAVWFEALAIEKWPLLPPAVAVGAMLRFVWVRYCSTFLSQLKRRLRFTQKTDRPSDIREENRAFQAKDFNPADYYREGQRFIGLDSRNQPYYVDESLYRETHHQIIGPTRYGKGVLLGCLMDQAIRAGDQVIYIDPKSDSFAPYILYAAAKATGRQFCYVALHDSKPGRWQPFAGGELRDALARAFQAFELQLTGDPATDYYKTHEREALEAAFRNTRTLKGLHQALKEFSSSKVAASLKQWLSLDALNPLSGKGFSISKALRKGDIVYVQGSLNDSIVKTATRAFITEVISESMRLKDERPCHLSLYVDEIRFLISKEIADALATAAGFNVNMTLAYQSLGDTLSPDDKTLDGRGLTQSININCQLKTIYGGFDPDTAKWVAESSGKITKEVTKLEKTEIRHAGAEVWDGGRSIGTQEEYLITENQFYSLPSRVCIQFQPATLATICHTAFVPVSAATREDFQAFLDSLGTKHMPDESEPPADDSPAPATTLVSIAESIPDVPEAVVSPTQEAPAPQGRKKKTLPAKADKSKAKPVIVLGASTPPAGESPAPCPAIEPSEPHPLLPEDAAFLDTFNALPDLLSIRSDEDCLKELDPA